MLDEEFAPTAVPEPCRELCGPYDVGEHDRGQDPVGLRGRTPPVRNSWISSRRAL
jgi:hypothetical protein